MYFQNKCAWEDCAFTLSYVQASCFLYSWETEDGRFQVFYLHGAIKTEKKYSKEKKYDALFFNVD